MENLRNEIVLELKDCIQHIEKTNFLFLPKFENAMAKVELFQEKAQSYTINQLMLILKGHLDSDSYPEVRVSNAWLSDIQQLLHVVENVVLQIPEN